ncbi:hypothetical protein, partial [Polynucleobacter sp. es-GGE-1]|uniref:hypothetical protein n=1 Tax=Polynucleobacter sp. es-GGE-1 TaxID=1819724 RepID=UPI001C0C1222
DLPLAISEQSVRLKTVLSSYLLLRLKESLSLKAFGLKIPGQVTTYIFSAIWAKILINKHFLSPIR